MSNESETQLPCGSGSPALPPALAALIREWEAISPLKWWELRKTKGHFLSANSPQWTHRVDADDRRQVRCELMAWTVSWFAERGYEVACEADPENTDGFGIRLVNALAVAPPESATPPKL